MTTTKIIEIHRFINLENGKKCKVISTRLPNGNFSVVFRGWNPFPCYSMETSWSTLQKWMTDNGWLELAGVKRIIERKEVIK